MTTATIEELLDKTKFEEWLRDRNPSANVGESGSLCHCPLGMYLDCKGYPGAEVHTDGRKILVNGKAIVPPLWVQHFVMLVDSLRDSKGNVRDHVKVRAYQAWAILGRIG